MIKELSLQEIESVIGAGDPFTIGLGVSGAITLASGVELTNGGYGILGIPAALVLALTYPVIIAGNFMGRVSAPGYAVMASGVGLHLLASMVLNVTAIVPIL